jgi:hypothetical protein
MELETRNQSLCQVRIKTLSEYPRYSSLVANVRREFMAELGYTPIEDIENVRVSMSILTVSANAMLTLLRADSP